MLTGSGYEPCSAVIRLKETLECASTSGSPCVRSPRPSRTLWALTSKAPLPRDLLPASSQAGKFNTDRPGAEQDEYATRDLFRETGTLAHWSRPDPRSQDAQSVEGGARSSSSAASRPIHREKAISEVAYLFAEKRGFAPGHELDDWLAAEKEIDSLLTSAQANSSGSQRHSSVITAVISSLDHTQTINDTCG